MQSKFRNETEFEQHLRQLIAREFVSPESGIMLLDNKNLADIVICKNTGATGIYFLEVKHLKPNMGRLGFGGKSGTGFQPEILTKRPQYLESNLRWAMYSESHDNDGIVFISSKKLCDSYLQGGSVGEKYNGIRQDIFNQEPGLTDDQFVHEMRSWVGC